MSGSDRGTFTSYTRKAPGVPSPTFSFPSYDYTLWGSIPLGAGRGIRSSHLAVPENPGRTKGSSLFYSTYGVLSLWGNELSSIVPLLFPLRYTLRTCATLCARRYYSRNISPNKKANVILLFGCAYAPLVARSAHPAPFILSRG
jgi:hypothetical protein